MSVVDTYIESMTFNRGRTLAALDRAEELGGGAFGWRPGPARAHVVWQLMHIGVTEEIFATERLKPEKASEYSEYWERFRGGSTPDDDLLSAERIRQVLAATRNSIVETLRTFDDTQLGDIVFPQREWTLATVLQVLSWHESHHQGQIHLTLNLYAVEQSAG